MLKINFSLVFFLLSSLSLNANAQLQLFACDTCNVQRMQHIAELQAPLLQCEGGINPETGVADIEYWENNATCFAPTKDLLVVNPVTRTAFKYRVKGHNPIAGESGYVMTLAMTPDESEIVQTYYDLFHAFADGIQALHSPIATSSNQSLSPQSMLLADDVASSSTSNQGISANCLNSAAAHFYSSAENRQRLTNELRGAIKDEVGRQTWRDFTSSLLATGAVSSGELSITTGVAAGISGSTSVAVQQQYIESTFVINPVGARSCRFFGAWCQEADSENNILYKVTYVGNVTTRGVNQLQIQLELLTMSTVDGLSGADLLGGMARANITRKPDSCLAQLINSTTSSDGGFVSAGPLGEPTPYNFGNGTLNYCEQSKTVRTCTNTGSGSQFVCYDTTFISLTLCAN